MAIQYGSLWLYPRYEDVDIHGKENLTRYVRGTGSWFYFCKNCGVTVAHSIYWVETGEMGLNMRTLEGTDIDSIKVYFDNGWAEGPLYDPWGMHKDDKKQAKED